MCHKGDIHYAETCIASIRTWNKAIPLYLHKDTKNGEFGTEHIEKHFRVNLCNNTQSSAGNILSSLLYVLQGPDLKTGERILVLDSDLVWLGDVIPLLESVDCDLLVSGQHHWKSTNIPKTDHPIVRQFTTIQSDMEGQLNSLYFDPRFWKTSTDKPLPNFVFNTGHYVYKVGSLDLEDFEGVITKQDGNWSCNPSIRLGDQGALNFVASLKTASESFHLESVPFMTWPKKSIVELELQKEIPAIAHWAGLMHKSTYKMSNGHVWRHYRRKFYSEIPFGKIKYPVWLIQQRLLQLHQRILNIRLSLLGKQEFIR